MNKMNSDCHSKTLKKRQYEPRRCCRISSYTCKIWSMVIVCIFLVIAASALLYFLLVKRTPKQETLNHIVLPKGVEFVAECPREYVKWSDRFDCYPEDSHVNQYMCESRGCCFLGDVKEGVNISSFPNCIYPNNYGYKMKDSQSTTENGFELSLQRLPTPSRYGDDIQVVNVLIEKQTPSRLRIKFYDPVSDRFEVPALKIPVTKNTMRHKRWEADQFLYTVTYNSSKVPFSLKVQRRDQLSKTIIFDTSVGALTLSHHFLELSTLLPSRNIYGIGGHILKQFTGDSTMKTWSLFADPNLKGEGGVHPMYLCVEDDGKAHGILLLNSNAMEIKLLPTPAISFRTIGGVMDFYVFLGPTPEEVVKQYSEAVGRSMLPPYWSLGLHAGRKNLHSVSEIKNFLYDWENKDVPLEVIHLELDIFDVYSSAFDEYHELSNITSEVQQKKQKVMISVQSSVRPDESLNSAYKIGLKNSVFLTDKWGLPLYGKVTGENVVYVDYGRSSTLSWWFEVLQKIFTNYIRFDGISMIDNEPLSEVDGGVNGCMNDDLNRPPYVPRGNGQTLYAKTVCMDAVEYWEGRTYAHYYLHNLYGHLMAISAQKAVKLLPEKQRKLLMSQSTFAGTGHFAGHWVEEVADSWDLFEQSIERIVNYNLYGIPSVGAKIHVCSFGDVKNGAELTLRWIQLSVFYPLIGIFDCQSEKHYFDGTWGKGFYNSVKQAVLQRYELLPYLYTLFYKAHSQGTTVMKFLMHEFPEDNITYSIKSQFMWGSALLISPVMKQGAKQILYYLPQGIWYKFPVGDMMISDSEWFNETVVTYDYSNPTVLHLRAGNIIVLQQPSYTTVESRLNPMKLVIALNASFEAEGILFWDDGSTRDSITTGEYKQVRFTVVHNTLTVNATVESKISRTNFNTAYIQHLQIMGLDANPKAITIDESYVISNKQRYWNPATKVLDIKRILIRLEGTTKLKW